MSDGLAHSILAEMDMLESILDRRGQSAHEAAVRSASGIKNGALADMLRTESAPAHIRDRIAIIRDFVAAGELEHAATESRTLQLRLDMITQSIRAPVLAFASKQLKGLADRRDAHNRERTAVSSAKIAGWQCEAERLWTANPHHTKNAVARAIKVKLSASESADWIARQIKKPRVAS